MGAIVLDCSATLPWVFADEASPAADALLDQLVQGERAWVPALWHLELGNVLLGAKRRNRIDQAGIEAFLSRLAVYDIAVDDQTMERAWQKTFDLALQYALSTYDASYFEPALRRGLPLGDPCPPANRRPRQRCAGLVRDLTADPGAEPGS